MNHTPVFQLDSLLKQERLELPSLPVDFGNNGSQSAFCLLSSTADYGTRSISASYRELLKPDAEHECAQGFRRMGVCGWRSAAKFIRRVQTGTLVCLFNAPTLLGAAFRRSKGVRSVAILDWTESFPPRRKVPFKKIYDTIYLWAFQRHSLLLSPVNAFRNYYNSIGANVQQCHYPLPHPIPEPVPRQSINKLRVLFIGADWKRKGGDLLLEAWSNRRPSHAELTFVCPSPPRVHIPGITFLTDITAGTPEQKQLLQSHDLFILPTTYDPFGFALLEALNYGMCVLTTEAAGAADVVKSFGGIVESTPLGCVQVAMQLVETPDEVLARRNVCFCHLPHYDAESRSFYSKICHSTS